MPSPSNHNLFSKLTNKSDKWIKGNFLNAFTYGSASAITQVLMMIYLLLIANWLGSTEYGYIAAAYAAATLSSFLFNWGFNEWMMKVGSTDERPEALGGEVVLLKTILGFFWGRN